MAEHGGLRHVGKSILRREDPRLLMGQGQYVADMVLPGMLHVYILRSPIAHARIRKVDLSHAAKAPGVVYTLNGADLERALGPVSDEQLPLPAKWKAGVKHKILNPRQPLLATDKVRHVGEAVAAIVAESRYAAEDAAELVELDLEELPAVIDPEAALKTGATLLHERFGTNLIGEFTIGKGDAAAAIAKAPHRLKRRFHHHRYAAIPMETRGALAQYDGRTAALTLWSSTQVVHWVRREVADTLGLPEARVRVVAPDVGGGFGVKGHVYPDEILISFLARAVGRPVKWIEDRREHLLSACHSRDQIHDVEMGFDNEGRILGYIDSFLADSGAWNPIGTGPMYNTAVHLLGPYRIDDFTANCKIAVTNKTPNAPYRGAGRPEAALATERMIDLIAKTLKLEPAEVRRRNMVTPKEMPYKAGLLYRDGEPIVYDSGDYPAALAMALEAVGGLEAFRKRQSTAREQGRYLGLGIGAYVEGTGVGPFEGATVRIDPSGLIHISAGACAHGQGMETIFSQITADAWKVKPEDIMVSLGDTSVIPMGFGTVASRSTVTVSAAVHHATERLLKKIFKIAAHQLECAVDDLELREGGVGIVGVPGKTLSLKTIARAAKPGWDHKRPEGVDAGLEETYYYEPPTVTWSYAVHIALVDVDIQTGRIAIEKYAVAHDCGVAVNPMLVEGQVVGGAAQGIGGGLYEAFRYDDKGQLLTTTFLDYHLPTASDIPPIEVLHLESPSPLNPLGVKGLGEGGAIAPPVALANAVSDALTPFGFEFNSTPIRPEQIALLKARRE